MSLATTVILGALSSILAAAVIWLGGRLIRATVGAAQQDRTRASAFSKALTDATDEALKRIRECIEYRDPVWYGPDNNWQTADSMIRQGGLGVFVSQIDALIPGAAARLPLNITNQVKELRDLCRTTWLDTSDPSVPRRAEQLGKAIKHAVTSPLGRSDTRRAKHRKRMSDEYDLFGGLEDALKKASSIITLNLKDGTEARDGCVGSMEAVSPTTRQFKLERLAEQFSGLAQSADALGWAPEAVLIRALHKQARAASIVHFERGGLQLENVATLKRLISELSVRLSLRPPFHL